MVSIASCPEPEDTNGYRQSEEGPSCAVFRIELHGEEVLSQVIVSREQGQGQGSG
jgi:hypothetical protein